MKQEHAIDLRKAAIIGCGFVGSATAFTLMQSKLFSELVLIDVDKARAEGEAMDISHGMPFAAPMKIYAGSYDDIVDADIIIITAGANQKPGETRLELVKKNVAIYKNIIPEIANRRCRGILLIVSNPVDILTLAALKLSGFPENRVIGSGTVLDTARLKNMLGKQLGIDNRGVHAFIVGEHGDSEVAVFSSANVSGIPLEQIYKLRGYEEYESHTKRIYEEVKNSAYEIIERKQATSAPKGSANSYSRSRPAGTTDRFTNFPSSKAAFESAIKFPLRSRGSVFLTRLPAREKKASFSAVDHPGTLMFENLTEPAFQPVSAIKSCVCWKRDKPI